MLAVSLSACQVLVSAVLSSPAHARQHDRDVESFVDKIMLVAGPMITNFGISGIVGFCVGKTIKVGHRLLVSTPLHCRAWHVCRVVPWRCPPVPAACRWVSDSHAIVATPGPLMTR